MATKTYRTRSQVMTGGSIAAPGVANSAQDKNARDKQVTKAPSPINTEPRKLYSDVAASRPPTPDASTRDISQVPAAPTEHNEATTPNLAPLESSSELSPIQPLCEENGG
ncbi:hypothetical protein D9619_013296 [Psilocybe cf. subviscida]|uniref:Uncharacterized protein n=1 Tax=Psilocybe cf. subviscida TaxID=2480587 RepID=A0A8H5BRT9_9AGAR|nr:hypothetical protein D9619_013296 [Psilocybe cf. subviscida]